MADFTLSQIGETSGSPVQPQQGVQTGAANAALSFVSDVGSALFGQYAEQQKEKQEQQQEVQASKSVSRFASQQMQIADLVDQGRLSSQEARMRMRYNLTRAGADNPLLYEAFAEAHGKVVGTAGMGKVAAEGTEQEQAFFAAQQEATKQGWVMPGMTQEEAAQSTIAWQKFNLEQQMIDAEQNAVALQRARVGLQTDYIQQDTARISQGTARVTQANAILNLEQKKGQVQAERHIGAMADQYTTRLNTKFNTWQRQVESGELPPEEAAQMMDEEWLAIESIVTEAGREAGSDYLSNVTSPMRRLYEVKRGFITGQVEREVMEEQSELAIAQQTRILTADPDDSRVIATSRIVGQGGSYALAPELTRIALNNVERNGSEDRKPADLTDSGNERDTEQYLSLVKNGVRRATEGRLDGGAEAERELTANLNQILKGVGIYGAASENPREFNQVVNFLASDDYGQYVENEGTGISQENAGNARAILEEKFDSVVRPLVAEEWRNASELTYAVPDPTRPETAGQTEPTTGLIRPFFDGSGIRFVPRNDTQVDARVRRKLEDLNKRVAPVVNRLVKMGAHLEGHRNYRQIYESNYAQMFGMPDTGSASE